VVFGLAADEEEGMDDDEALARRLQEQEDALATRGRATRGALRVTLKPKQAAQKGPSTGRGAVRSSSRLKPLAVQPKQRPTTRGSAGNPPQVIKHKLCIQHAVHMLCLRPLPPPPIIL